MKLSIEQFNNYLDIATLKNPNCSLKLEKASRNTGLILLNMSRGFHRVPLESSKITPFTRLDARGWSKTQGQGAQIRFLQLNVFLVL